MTEINVSRKGIQSLLVHCGGSHQIRIHFHDGKLIFVKTTWLDENNNDIRATLTYENGVTEEVEY